MKRSWMMRLLSLALACLMLAPAVAAGEDAEALPDLAFLAGGSAGGDTVIFTQTLGGERWLFLPSSADPARLVLRFSGPPAVFSGGRGTEIVESGAPFSLEALAERDAEGCYCLTVSRDGDSFSLRILFSENLRALYLRSGDPEKGREWVEERKSNKVKDASAVLLRADGSTVYDGELKQIKGRGNSTWSMPKKPYQIKLAQPADLLETGEAGETQTTWVLLANYWDLSLLRNQITFALAAELGLPYSPHSAQVDLYYDGEYRGVYQLSEKTEAGEGRVETGNLEQLLKEANPEAGDFDTLPRAFARQEGGAVYQYTPGLTMPEHPAGGYLLELDYEERALEEASWFRTPRGATVVCKSPEVLPAQGMEEIIRLYRSFEEAVYHGGVDPESGRPYTDFADLDSLALCYLILELSGNNDAYSSSTFFYWPAGEERLYAGPVWDFDSAYGNSDKDYAISDTEPVAGAAELGAHLLALPDFRARVRELYIERVEPLLREVLLSGDAAARRGELRSLACYDADCAAARRMNDILWTRERDTHRVPLPLTEYLSRRSAWFRETLERWEAGEVTLPFYGDVPESAWYASAVREATELGLFRRSLRFLPEENMLRGGMFLALYRLAGCPPTGAEDPFSDTAPLSELSLAAAWGAERGLFRGVSEDRLGAELPLTREQLVTVLYRFAQSEGIVSSRPAGEALDVFPDGDAVSPFAREAVCWAAASGLLRGTGSGLLEPLAPCSRGEGAALLMRFAEAAGRTG